MKLQLEARINKLLLEKQIAIDNQDYERAAAKFVMKNILFVRK